MSFHAFHVSSCLMMRTVWRCDGEITIDKTGGPEDYTFYMAALSVECCAACCNVYWDEFW